MEGPHGMLGLDIHSVVVQPIDMEYVACKIPRFSFSRLRNSDPRLGVEMQSTGEVWVSLGISDHGLL